MAGEQLRVIEGTERGKRLSVDTDLLIGRVAEHEGRLGNDPEISRHHARVSRGADGRLTIEDLGSANGTFVNGQRIDTPRTLGPGDSIRIGRTQLEVTAGSGAVSQEPGGADVAVAEGSGGEGDDAGEELVITAGATPGRRLKLTGELLIGRGVSGAGRLSDDRELSRRHARISRGADGRLTVEDLGSANGTFVNGKRLRDAQVLSVGDSVRVGSTILQLSAAGKAAAPPRGTPAEVPAARPAPPRVAPDIPAAAARAPASATGSRELSSALAPGSVFAGCRVEEVIGHGDMGVVYRAEELALQRQVALKLILPEHSREDRFRERFRRESMIAAAIDHPNVIPIFDAGDEDGVLYITMRLVEGTDMRALIAGGRIEPLRAARIVRQVGAALDAAHAHGMLHRDVKPSNVLLGREDHAYLSDFGLAKREASAGLTRQESIIARAEYVAPEQLLNQRVDARADIYALGCLLFEALTSEPPFARWNQGAAALAHLDAPRPSPVALCPDLPRDFDDVVGRAMAVDPGERYPSAGDLGQAALVAAGGLRQAGPWSVVATGEAAPLAQRQPAGAVAAGAPRAEPAAPASNGAARGRDDRLRWAIALAGLVLVAVGMVAALHGISTL
jgi:pSer/pThr/pTyr-binding forkhead associated (FHA) protein/predicted Ser/Thr protein kinase